MLGPFYDNSHLPPLHFNRIGVIPKGHQAGKWRLITDLSFPHGMSVNGGIDRHMCSLSYTTVDHIAAAAARMGVGALLAKVDIEAANCLIPVHPHDRPLQAFRWEGKIFIDPMLPFGLRSAPKIFNAVADALHWHLVRSGVSELFHYLDDFIIVGPPDSDHCAQSLAILDRVCSDLKVPMAAHKREGPASSLVVLGIEIDTARGELRLPEHKLSRLLSLLAKWEGKKRGCSRTELESLVGHLNHAAKVVRSGRCFIRRMYNLLKELPESLEWVRLNQDFRSDLQWWSSFLPSWNGVSFLPPPSFLPTVEVTSDASGTWGCGAWHHCSWFQVQWGDQARPLSIREKELIPIILALLAWGRNWSGHQVTCHCDNQVVVACLRSRTSKVNGLMHLLRCLWFVEAKMGCFLRPMYIDTHTNILADALSRNNLSLFFSQFPMADPYPTPVSLPLLELLLHQEADWLSPRWTSQFNAIFSTA